MGKILTTKAVEAAKPGAARKEIPDGGSGLYLVVQPSGAKGWAVRYRFAGKPKKLVLGKFPAIGLADARERAKDALRLLPDTDPAEARREKDAAEIERQRDDVESVIDRFIARHAKRKNRSWSETERILMREIVPKWKARPITDIRKRDVIDLVEGIVDLGAPTMANRTFAAVRKLFGWAAEQDIIEASPCAGLRPPAPEVKRDRVLTDPELVAVWKAADAEGYPFGPLVKLLVLTGQRREEVAQARWSEMDLDGATWTIPADRAKNGKPHLVPLSPAALDIIKALPRIAPTEAGGRPVWLFTTSGTTPVSGFSRVKSRLDEAALGILNKDAPDPAPFPPWRLHDLRRTMASGMAALGINLPVVEKVLNHISGSFGGVAGVYQRHSFADEKRVALDAWARHVGGLIEGTKADNVVALRPAVEG